MKRLIEIVPVLIFCVALILFLVLSGKPQLIVDFIPVFIYGGMTIWLLTELIRRTYRKFYPSQKIYSKYEHGRERRFWKYKRIIVPRLFLGIFGAIIGMAWLIWSLG